MFTGGHSRICYATSEISSQCLKGYSDGFTKASDVISDRPLAFRGFQGTTHGFLRLFMENRSFSSLTGTKSSGEEDSDSDDGFQSLNLLLKQYKKPTKTSSQSLSMSSPKMMLMVKMWKHLES